MNKCDVTWLYTKREAQLICNTSMHQAIRIEQCFGTTPVKIQGKIPIMTEMALGFVKAP